MKELVLTGLGGQGVLTVGLLLSQMATFKGYQATWSPSYGSAMRGGTAMCTVKFNDGLIYHPTADSPDILLAMNLPGYNTYAPTVKPGGVIVLNADMVPRERVKEREDVKYLWVHCNQMAHEMDFSKGANIIMAGIIAKESGEFTFEEARDGMNDMFRKKGKEKFEAMNTEALKAGWEFAEAVEEVTIEISTSAMGR